DGTSERDHPCQAPCPTDPGSTMSTRDHYDYSEDMFSDTRMSFGEHLAELQMYLWRAIYGFLIALFVSFFIGRPMLRVIAAPVTRPLEVFDTEHDARMG